MAKVVITEFMDAAGVDVLAGLDVLYDPQLVDKPDALRAALADCLLSVAVAQAVAAPVAATAASATAAAAAAGPLRMLLYLGLGEVLE